MQGAAWASHRFACGVIAPCRNPVIGQQNQTEESELNATTVALGLANSVFDLAKVDSNWKIMERARLARSRFERVFGNREVALGVMEPCGSAYHRPFRFLEAPVTSTKVCRTARRNFASKWDFRGHRKPINPLRRQSTFGRRIRLCIRPLMAVGSPSRIDRQICALL